MLDVLEKKLHYTVGVIQNCTMKVCAILQAGIYFLSLLFSCYGMGL